MERHERATVSENFTILHSLAFQRFCRYGIFDTYFEEFGFKFNSANTTVSYNSQGNPGGLQISSSGTMYYALFNVDTSNLANGYSIHFDLYNTTKDKDGNVIVDINAPFSHDANSNGNVPIPAAV